MNANVKYTILAPLHPRQNLYACSNVFAGILRLESQGLARVHFALGRSRELHPAIVTMEVVRDDGASCRLGIDILDRSDEFDAQMLENLDVYFKRSYRAEGVQALAPDLRGKILPIGPYFPCRISGLAQRLMSAMGVGYLLRLSGSAVCDRERFADDRHILKQFLTLPVAGEYEAAPMEPSLSVVLFQTRVWEQREVSLDDVSEINEPRVGLVRALRREFGGRFCGGIVPTPFALRNFPDVITRQPHRLGEYVKMSKHASIGVSTRGLHHSTPFKLGEYLASSKAIVSQPIDDQLGVPLREGTHYLSFRGADECVGRCAELLSDPGRTLRMRYANHRYYLEQVEPAAAIAKCIDSAFAKVAAFAKDLTCARPVLAN
jgi:hypothetical protein